MGPTKRKRSDMTTAEQRFSSTISGYLHGEKALQSDLAKQVGVSQSAVSLWMKGELPSLDNAIRIADVLHVSLDELLGRGGLIESPEEARRSLLARRAIPIPLVGSVRCGRPDQPSESVWVYADENGGFQVADASYHLVAREMFQAALRGNDPVCFVKVEGSSMMPEYKPGVDTLLVEKTGDVSLLRTKALIDEMGEPHWDHVVVDLHGQGKYGEPGQYTMKEIRMGENGRWILVPINIKYHQPMEATDDMVLWGIVIGVFRLRMYPDMVKIRARKAWRE